MHPPREARRARGASGEALPVGTASPSNDAIGDGSRGRCDQIHPVGALVHPIIIVDGSSAKKAYKDVLRSIPLLAIFGPL